MITKKHLLVWSLATVLAVPAFAEGKHEEHDDDEGQAVALTSTPAAVQATIAAQVAGGKVVKVEQETEDGITTYEAKIKLPGDKELEVKVAADGKLLESKAEAEEGEDDDQK